VPEIPLLEPTVLRGVVEKLMASENLTLLNRMDKTPWPFPTAQWDVVKGSRQVARPNVPNAEAHIVNRLGRTQESATFVYLREKKLFTPTVLRWIRTPGQLAARNAEAQVLREIADLNQRFDNFAELLLWRALSGFIRLRYADVVADVDYKFPSSHKVAPAVAWSSATIKQMIGDIRAWKRIVQRDGGVALTEAYGTECTINSIFDATQNATVISGAVNMYGAALMTDRMKDEYYRTGTVPGFMGINWNMIQSVYDDDLGVAQDFVPNDVLFMGNYDEQRPIELLIGPSADDEAPEGFTGKFSKTWKEKDPSTRQYLLEWSLLPVITRPEQMLVVSNIGACSAYVGGTARTGDIMPAMPGSQ
jgi:hypothetical protein